MTGDAVWYEAAFVVGMTNALNVVADGLAGAMEPLDDHDLAAEAVALLAEVHAFYGEVPLPLRVVARDAGYLTDLWDAARRAFDDGRLPRRLKAAIAFAVSLTTRSAFGTPFHRRQLTRLGVGEGGLMELVGVAQMFSSYTKIADTLQLESDMGGIAPVDSTGVPEGLDGR